MNTGPAPTIFNVGGQPLFASLYWDTPPGVARYVVRRAFAGTTTWTTVLDAPATPLTMTVDRLPDHQRSYTYELFAYQADGTFGTIAANFTPPTPVDPSGFTATVPGPGEVEFRWNNVVDVSFLLGGPGTGAGVTVLGETRDPAVPLTYRLKGVPAGTHTWTVASSYNTGGVLTAPNAWPKATATITIPDPAVRYRLTAIGVKALQQTADNIFAIDGMGDEIYVGALINSTTRQMSPQLLSTARSTSYGDVGTANAFPGRVQGGTYGAKGGIKTGDLVPVNLNLAAPSGTPNILGFPLLLWEGVLDDNAMVVVEPAVWEDDVNNRDFAMWTSRARAVYGQAPYITQVSAMRDQNDLGPQVVSGRHFLCCLPDDPLDRPIGVVTNVDGDHLPLRLVVLTKTIAEAALSRPGQIPGSTPGLIVVPLHDNSMDRKASYELYLRLERLP